MSKSTKNNKKKFNLLSKVDFHSVKTRMAITVLSFAVIGGGYMVFKSFAASSSTYTVGNGTFTIKPNTGSSYYTETTGSKSNMKGIKFARTSTPVNGTYLYGFANISSNPQIWIPEGSSYRICITEKGIPIPSDDARQTIISWKFNNSNNQFAYNFATDQSLVANVDGIYAKVCSKYMSSFSNQYGPIQLIITNAALTNHPMYVSSVSIETK